MVVINYKVEDNKVSGKGNKTQFKKGDEVVILEKYKVELEDKDVLATNIIKVDFKDINIRKAYILPFY